jgi:hypothetical protein
MPENVSEMWLDHGNGVESRRLSPNPVLTTNPPHVFVSNGPEDRRACGSGSPL